MTKVNVNKVQPGPMSVLYRKYRDDFYGLLFKALASNHDSENGIQLR